MHHESKKTLLAVITIRRHFHGWL